MIETGLYVLTGWFIVSVIQFLFWRLAMSRGNTGWIEPGACMSVFFLILWYAAIAEGAGWRRLFYLVLGGIWVLRLGQHVLQRVLDEEYEDFRYMLLRRKWGDSARRKSLFLFLGAGLACMVLTLPVLVLMSGGRSNPTWYDLAGALLFLGAVAGEAVADRQLLRWKEKPENLDLTCREGLWSLCRHPNYFFEWLHWLAYPVLGLSLLGTGLAEFWPVTLLGPLVMLVTLLRFTGIPPAEKKALTNRGEDYRTYQREVSAFIPWIPRKSR